MNSMLTRMGSGLALLTIALACRESTSPSQEGPSKTGTAPTGDEASGSFVRAPEVVGFGMTVADLDAQTRFFVDILGASVEGRKEAAGAELSDLVGVTGVSARTVHLRLGEERVSLTAYTHTSTEIRIRSAPVDTKSNDALFQHLALVVSDMDAAYRRVVQAGVPAISVDGPQEIPEYNVAAAGIRAYYFQDPEHHPLELIWFPKGKGDARWHRREGGLVLGIDHSAFAVSSTAESLRFYKEGLGLRVAGRSFNYGVEQERLSGVAGARVRITGLRGSKGPGLEFLQYEHPGPGRSRPIDATPLDLFHWESVVRVPDLQKQLGRLLGLGGKLISRRPARCELCVIETRAVLVADPDGHVLRLAGN